MWYRYCNCNKKHLMNQCVVMLTRHLSVCLVSDMPTPVIVYRLSVCFTFCLTVSSLYLPEMDGNSNVDASSSSTSSSTSTSHNHAVKHRQHTHFSHHLPLETLIETLGMVYFNILKNSFIDCS